MDQSPWQVVDRVESAQAGDQVIAFIWEGELIVEAICRVGFLYRDALLAQSCSQFPRPVPDDQGAAWFVAQKGEPFLHVFNHVVEQVTRRTSMLLHRAGPTPCGLAALRGKDDVRGWLVHKNALPCAARPCKR